MFLNTLARTHTPLHLKTEAYERVTKMLKCSLWLQHFHGLPCCQRAPFQLPLHQTPLAKGYSTSHLLTCRFIYFLHLHYNHIYMTDGNSCKKYSIRLLFSTNISTLHQVLGHHFPPKALFSNYFLTGHLRVMEATVFNAVELLFL